MLSDKASAIFETALMFARQNLDGMLEAKHNQCVMVDHGDYYTLYCKLRNVTVKADDKIETGDVLGTVDTINGQTQLHFELWQGKKPLDPEIWLK